MVQCAVQVNHHRRDVNQTKGSRDSIVQPLQGCQRLVLTSWVRENQFIRAQASCSQSFRNIRQGRYSISPARRLRRHWKYEGMWLLWWARCQQLGRARGQGSPWRYLVSESGCGGSMLDVCMCAPSDRPSSQTAGEGKAKRTLVLVVFKCWVYLCECVCLSIHMHAYGHTYVYICIHVGTHAHIAHMWACVCCEHVFSPVAGQTWVMDLLWPCLHQAAGCGISELLILHSNRNALREMRQFRRM